MDQKDDSFTANGPGDAGALSEAETRLGAPFPAEYRKFMEAQDGGEGFVGEDYLILWRAGDLARLNEAYEAPEYAPGLVLFGSNGCGDAYAFDTNDDATPVVSVPFVGMSLEETEFQADSFEEFLSSFEEDGSEPYTGERPPKDMEMFYIQPLMLGGDPDDPKNVTLLPREKHIEAVRYWNGVVNGMNEEE